MNSSFDSDDSDELLISLQLGLARFAAEVSDASDNDAHITSSNLSADVTDLQNTLSQFHHYQQWFQLRHVAWSWEGVIRNKQLSTTLQHLFNSQILPVI